MQTWKAGVLVVAISACSPPADDAVSGDSGVVRSRDEKRTVASIARSIAGVGLVEDQLEIAGPDGQQSQLEGE